ncbi:maleylpyruvate isomerase N-terminal domain-containing protein [Janibacter sp. G56]|uniref:maleylpyruvate isomerase N-terminal domain-containing protein n=1 Tax=Janibacter sp. G56 TaxID=3418717 RepID=UPI003CFBE060
MTEPLSPADHLVELVGATALLSAAAASFGDEAAHAPVPTCPGWTVEQVVAHAGATHRWAAAAARGTSSPGRPPEWDRSIPLIDWYVAGAGELLATLGATDPDAPAWTFSRAHDTAAFWRRRQLHEATIHGVDILLAGDDADDEIEEVIDPTLAVDGIDEVLTTFLQRSIDRQRAGDPLDAVPAPEPLVLIATDLPDEDGGDNGTASWTVHVDGGRVITRRLGDEEPDVVASITAPAPRLYLALWGRADRAGLELGGDTESASRFLRAPLVP